MDKRLVNILLRLFHAEEMEFVLSASLKSFHDKFNVGRLRGKKLILTERDKADIKALLKAEAGIEAETTYQEDWAAASRSESLALGKNEKYARRVVSDGRLQCKALQGQKVYVAGQEWELPDGFDIGGMLSTVLANPIHHDAIVVVENKQTFDQLWHISHGLFDEVKKLNPLVVFRGDSMGGARADATNGLIEATDLPVWAFVDYDPAGIVIASSLPRLDHLVAPSITELLQKMEKHGLRERYETQISGAGHVMTAHRSNPVLSPTIKVIDDTGKGLPQEWFHK